MTDHEVEFTIYKIILGKNYFTHNKEEYYLTSPSNEIRYNGLKIYFDIIEEEKYNGWLRESVLDRLLIASGCWTQDTRQSLKRLEKNIDKQKKELYKQRLSEKTVDSIRKQLASTRKQIDQILQKRDELYQHTLEGYANNIKNEYVISHCLFKDGKKVFDFNKNNISFILFNSLINASNETTLSVSDIRSVAKSSMWRSIWSCNKNNTFDISGAINYNNDQKVLINLSLMYDSVYDHTERPEDFVIKDDDMLDGWMIYLKDKIKSQEDQNKVSSTHKNAQEVFVMADSQESLERIQEMNDDIGLQKIQSRLNYLKQNNTVMASDDEMPDIAADIDKEMQQKARSKGFIK